MSSPKISCPSAVAVAPTQPTQSRASPWWLESRQEETQPGQAGDETGATATTPHHCLQLNCTPRTTPSRANPDLTSLPPTNPPPYLNTDPYDALVRRRINPLCGAIGVICFFFSVAWPALSASARLETQATVRPVNPVNRFARVESRRCRSVSTICPVAPPARKPSKPSSYAVP